MCEGREWGGTPAVCVGAALPLGCGVGCYILYSYFVCPMCPTHSLLLLYLLLGRVATASLSGLETLLESSVRSYLVGNAGSRPISEAKQPWACLVLRWGTTGEAHVLYSLTFCQVLID